MLGGIEAATLPIPTEQKCGELTLRGCTRLSPAGQARVLNIQGIRRDPWVAEFGKSEGSMETALKA